MYRLLIADDNLDSARKTQSLLDWSAFGISSITVATSYTEAEDRALDLRPHLALVNVRLGAYMGYELVAHLRSLGLKTVFCMLADNANPDQIRESMRSGARDYLTRPLNPCEMRSFLERGLISSERSFPSEADSGGQDLDPVLMVPYSTLSKVTNRIIRVIRSDYRSSQTLTAIAEDLNMSSKYIGRVFLKDTGIKFSEYLMAYRMMEAKRRIISTNEKISVIASSVGYVQMNNFYIHFKNYFGISPSAMRGVRTPRDQAKATIPGGTHEESV